MESQELSRSRFTPHIMCYQPRDVTSLSLHALSGVSHTFQGASISSLFTDPEDGTHEDFGDEEVEHMKVKEEEVPMEISTGKSTWLVNTLPLDDSPASFATDDWGFSVVWQQTELVTQLILIYYRWTLPEFQCRRTPNHFPRR